MTRLLLLYDYFQVSGGAERVMLDMARYLGPAELWVSRVFPEAHHLLAQSPVTVGTLGGGSTRWLTRVPESMWVFLTGAKRQVRDASTVVYSGFYSPLALVWQRQGQRVYYCHTIPRYAYDLLDYYRNKCPRGTRWVYSGVMALWRRVYEYALSRMDLILVNSVNVQHRLLQHTGLASTVLYPPVDVESFRWQADDGYYLSVARISPLKRVDAIVEAFLQMPERTLVVLSDGPERQRLQQRAAGAPNIRFIGGVSETALRTWIGRARAAIYVPMDEDLGLSPVECMAAGKPVIGVAEGGLLETVRHGETGYLIKGSPSPDALAQALQWLDQQDAVALRHACERRAQQFGRSVFVRGFSAAMAKLSSRLA